MKISFPGAAPGAVPGAAMAGSFRAAPLRVNNVLPLRGFYWSGIVKCRNIS
jgi:hypothetical protein